MRNNTLLPIVLFVTACASNSAPKTEDELSVEIKDMLEYQRTILDHSKRQLYHAIQNSCYVSFCDVEIGQELSESDKACVDNCIKIHIQEIEIF